MDPFCDIFARVCAEIKILRRDGFWTRNGPSGFFLLYVIRNDAATVNLLLGLFPVREFPREHQGGKFFALSLHHGKAK